MHHDDVEYVSFAAGEGRAFRGLDGMREVWAESRANWTQFRFAVLAEENGLFEVAFTGIEPVAGTELTGALWFRVEARGGRIARLWSALDAELLPAG